MTLFVLQGHNRDYYRSCTFRYTIFLARLPRAVQHEKHLKIPQDELDHENIVPFSHVTNYAMSMHGIAARTIISNDAASCFAVPKDTTGM